MKLAIWSLGVIVILGMVEFTRTLAQAWTWVWVVSGVWWVLLGAALALGWVVRVAGSKVPGGVWPGLRRTTSVTPRTDKEE